MLSVNGDVNAMPRKVSCKLVIGSDTITNVKLLTYSSDWSGDITIGQVVSSYITATIPTPSFSLTGANVSHSMGISNSGGSVAWCDIGQYKVDHNSIRTKQGYTSFTAYDKLHDTVNTYTANSAYADTVQGLCNDVCNQIGITSIVSLGNIGAVAVDKASLSGYTLRDVLGFVAAICGKNAYVSASNQLELRWFANTSYTADDTRANVPYIGENNCTIGRLICQGADGVYTIGTGEGIYFSCPLITQDNQASILNYLYGLLAGFSYRKADVDIPYGTFLLQSGDIITVSTTGSNLTVPIMANSFSYDGGLSSTASAYGVSDYSGTANNAERSVSSRRVQAVNTNKQTVTSLTKLMNEAERRITGATGGYIRIEYGGDNKTAQLTISDEQDIVNDALNLWIFNQEGLGHMGRESTSDPWGLNIALIKEGTLVAERIAGEKISGVKLETIATGTGLLAPSQVVVEEGTYTINKVSNGTVSNVGKMEYKDRSSVSDNDSLSIQVKSGASFTIGVLDANGGLGNPEFFYYSDLSQAPSGADKFQLFGGNLKIVGNNLIVNGQSGGDVLFGDSGNLSLRALYNEIYDPNNGILKRLSDLESRV